MAAGDYVLAREFQRRAGSRQKKCGQRLEADARANLGGTWNLLRDYSLRLSLSHRESIEGNYVLVLLGIEPDRIRGRVIPRFRVGRRLLDLSGEVRPRLEVRPRDHRLDEVHLAVVAPDEERRREFVPVEFVRRRIDPVHA